MHLLILGLVLIIGILVYYIASTSSYRKQDDSSEKEQKPARKKVSDDLKREDNVIFLPTDKNGDADSTGDGDASDADHRED